MSDYLTHLAEGSLELGQPVLPFVAPRSAPAAALVPSDVELPPTPSLRAPQKPRAAAPRQAPLSARAPAERAAPLPAPPKQRHIKAAAMNRAPLPAPAASPPQIESAPLPALRRSAAAPATGPASSQPAIDPLTESAPLVQQIAKEPEAAAVPVAVPSPLSAPQIETQVNPAQELDEQPEPVPQLTAAVQQTDEAATASEPASPSPESVASSPPVPARPKSARPASQPPSPKPELKPEPADVLPASEVHERPSLSEATPESHSEKDEEASLPASPTPHAQEPDWELVPEMSVDAEQPGPDIRRWPRPAPEAVRASAAPPSVRQELALQEPVVQKRRRAEHPPEPRSQPKADARALSPERAPAAELDAPAEDAELGSAWIKEAQEPKPSPKSLAVSTQKAHPEEVARATAASAPPAEAPVQSQPEAPVIRVNIGRVELRMAAPQAAAPRPAQPRLTLRDFLKQQ